MVFSVAQFRGKSEPTALAAGLEVGRCDLQTVWPMLMFLIDSALKMDSFSFGLPLRDPRLAPSAHNFSSSMRTR